MKKIFFFLILLLTSSVNVIMAQIDCSSVEDFEGPINNISNPNLTFYEQLDWSNLCSDNNFTGFTPVIAQPNNYFATVEHTDNLNGVTVDPIINFFNGPTDVNRFNLSGQAIKLNSSNTEDDDISNNVRSAGMMKIDLVNPITSNFLNINYAAIFHVPNHTGPPPFIRIIIESPTEIIFSQTVKSDGTTNIPSLPGFESAGANFSLRRYLNWNCLSFDLTEHQQRTDLSLRIIASDCAIGGHDGFVYLDDICLSDTSCGPIIQPLDQGNITLNPINDVDCNVENIVISGTLDHPTDGPNSATLEVLFTSFNPGGNPPINVFTFNPPTTYTGSTYSMNIDPNILPCTDCIHSVTINTSFGNGTTAISNSESFSLDLTGCEAQTSVSGGVISENCPDSRALICWDYTAINGPILESAVLDIYYSNPFNPISTSTTAIIDSMNGTVCFEIDTDQLGFILSPGQYSFILTATFDVGGIDVNVIADPVIFNESQIPYNACDIIAPCETPLFSEIGPICSTNTDVILPTTSNNGYEGTWSPSVVNNLETTTYTFTPNAPCTETASLTIVVEQQQNAGEDVNITFCNNDNTNYNLADYLIGADPGGIWSEPYTDGIFNPVLDGGSGFLTIFYAIPATDVCDRDFATILITIDTLCSNPCAAEDLNSFVNGNNLEWVDITDGDYFIEFMSDDTCPNGDMGSFAEVSYQQNGNSLNLNTVVNALQRKCFRYRIRTNCSPWSDWCLIGAGGPGTSVPFVYYGDCIPSNSCDDYQALINITDNVLSGTTVNYETYVDITASNIIENGASSTYKASNSITLQPGFHAENGSYFHAYIEECIINIATRSHDTNNDSSLNNGLVQGDIVIFPNPASSEINISASVQNLSGYQLYNTLGQLIKTMDHINYRSSRVDVQDLARGFYILKVTLEDNSVINKTVILE